MRLFVIIDNSFFFLDMDATVPQPKPPVPHSRSELRQELLARRKAWSATPAAHAAAMALSRSLHQVLEQLEPQCLGLYWPLDGEFNAVDALLQDLAPKAGSYPSAPPRGSSELGAARRSLLQAFDFTLALPFAYKNPRRMDYRLWDGQPPSIQDECGIGSSAGAPVQPDVVLVPCVGFTAEGYRLGYGGGYYDRWLAQHPGVISVGLAWDLGRTQFAIKPHDQALTLVLTETEVISP